MDSASAGSPAPVAEVTLVAVGDLMLARSVGHRIVSDGPDAVFDDELRTLLRGADLTLGNLECVISEYGEPAPKSYTFRAPPAAAAALASAGFDAVALANNHSLDYGPGALLDTIARLAGAGVAAAGAGSDGTAAMAPAVFERSGLRIAVVSLVDAPAEGSFSRDGWEARTGRPGVAWADAGTVAAAVSDASAQADVVIVMLHFGNEYATTPTSKQRELAHAAIDAGALLVVGSHPHLLQEVEEYGGGLIAYSLGNFVFDGFEGDANTTAVLRVTLGASGVASWSLLPASIDWSGLPRLDH